jgi:hypothetical protein
MYMRPDRMIDRGPAWDSDAAGVPGETGSTPPIDKMFLAEICVDQKKEKL